jgi:thiol-disulfide isomerase/thioredoxin
MNSSRVRLYILWIGLWLGNAASGQVQKIPDFRFIRLSGAGPFSPKDLKPGKKTLFLFFDTECPHCMQALSAWNENHTALDGINAVLLTMDPPTAAIPFLRNFADKLVAKKHVVTAIDTDRQFISRFLPKKYPSMFLFSEKGALLHYTDEEKDIPSLIRTIRKK